MKTVTTLLCIVMLLFSKISVAQDQLKLDSLIQAYNSHNSDTIKVKTAHALYDFYYGNNPDSAMYYSNEGLKFSKYLNYEFGIAQSYRHKAKAFKNIRQLDSASIYFQKALEIYKRLGDKHLEGVMIAKKIYVQYSNTDYNNALKAIDKNMAIYSTPVKDSTVIMMLLGIQGRIYMRQANYKKGFEATVRAIEIAEKIGDEHEKNIMTGTLSSLYHYTNDRKQAIILKQKVLEYYRKINDRRLIALALNDIGNSNYVIENYDIALSYLEESLPISREMKINGLVGITLFNIGKTYVKKGDVNKGIEYLEKSIYHSQHISHHPLSESWALKRLGSVYTEELKMPEKALPYLNRAIVLADSVGNKDDLYQSYRDRSEAYAALGDYKNALRDHQAYKATNDSVYNLEKSKEIDRLKTEFETKEKEQQITLQENEIGLLEQKDKISGLQKSLLTVGLLLSLGLITFGFYGFRQRIKRNKLEKEKVDAELAFKRKELTTHALHLAKKNEVLESLKLKAEELKNSDYSQTGYQQLIRTIDFDLKDDNNWENFSNYFQEVHKDFNRNVKQKFPEVTSNELRLMSLLKMNLSSKEIANILNISQEGIKKARYRLRKKLDISTEDSLQDLVLSL